MKLATIFIVLGLAMSCMCFMDRELQDLAKSKSTLVSKHGVKAKHLMHVTVAIARVKNQVMGALPAVRKIIKMQENKNDIAHHSLKTNLKKLAAARAAHSVKKVVLVIKKIKANKTQLHNIKTKLTMFKAQRHLVNKARAMAHQAKKVAKKVHKAYAKVSVAHITNICCDHKAAPKKVVVHKKLAKKAAVIHHKLKKVAKAIKIIRKITKVITRCSNQKGKALKQKKQACKIAIKAKKAKKEDKVATNMCKQAKITYKIKYVKCKKVVRKVKHVVKKVAKQVKVKVHTNPKHCHCTPKKIVIRHNKVVIVKKPIIQRAWRAYRHCVIHWKLLTVGSKAWTGKGWVKGMRKMKVPKKIPMKYHKAYKFLLKKDIATGMSQLKKSTPNKKVVKVMKKDVKKVEQKKHLLTMTRAQINRARTVKKHAKKSKKVSVAKKVSVKHTKAFKSLLKKKISTGMKKLHKKNPKYGS